MSIQSFKPEIIQHFTSENSPFIVYDEISHETSESFLLQTTSDRTKIQIWNTKNNKPLTITLSSALSEKEQQIESLKNQTLSFARWNKDTSFITVTEAGTVAWWQTKNDTISCITSHQTLSEKYNKIYKTALNDQYLFIRKGVSTETTSYIDVYNRFSGEKITSKEMDLKYLDEAFTLSGIFQTTSGESQQTPTIKHSQFQDKEQTFKLIKEASLNNTSIKNIRTICAINDTWIVCAPWRKGSIKIKEFDYSIVQAKNLSEHSVIQEPISYRELLCDQHLVMWSTKPDEGMNIWNIPENKKEASIPWKYLTQKSSDTNLSLLHAEIANKKVKILYQENEALKTAEFPLEIVSSIEEKVIVRESKPKDPKGKSNALSDLTKKFSSLFKK